MIQKEKQFAEVSLFLPLDKTFHYSIPYEMADKIRKGIRVEVPFGSRKTIGCVMDIAQDSPVENVKEIIKLYDEEPFFTEEMFLLAEWISKNYLCSLGEALATIIPSNIHAPRRIITKVRKKEYVFEQDLQPKPVLTDDQNRVIEPILERIKSQQYKSFVLRGVTSSGKTEVYLAIIEKIIQMGKSTIYLLPEISLTPQFIQIVQNRFPEQVGVWHSKLTGSQRFRTWNNARKGAIKIMLGARSAIFAPFPNLGLIIVDEEHEPTYKQDNKPTYHIREVSNYRAQLNNAAVIFGSATPSLESYYKAKQGIYQLLEIKERIDKRVMPPVKIVDCTHLSRNSSIISKPLSDALTKTLAKREQAIIFLNRRGFSPVIICQRCGNVWQCNRCSVSMVYHRTTNDLRCHYCGFKHPWPKECKHCKSHQLSVFGVGTQKVEEALNRQFPQARVFRLDRDTALNREVYYKAYEEFKNENYDILLGTQMVAKGFDFPRVTLVGVIDADTALHLPDFRAAERTFQLITQVAGRSGRSELGGDVIVQTRYPNHYALLAAKNHDYVNFYEKEISYRKQMNYPPFSHFVNILVRASNEKRAFDSINKIYYDLKQFREKNNLDYRILGPTPAAHSKLRRLFRWQLMLKGDPGNVLEAATKIRNYYLPRGILMNVDVDPQDVL
ncbi:MAG: primosomal protein N' [Endomicrobiales bacterium]|nr:primosomal protein N' [Endomicrobiales bacterium]